MTTEAVVIRRDAGRWSAFHARVLRCEMKIARSVGDTASRVTMQQLVAQTRRQCGVSITDVGPGDQLLTTDTLIVDRLGVADSLIERAWTVAERAGASELPARVRRNRVPQDDRNYVVELRRGDNYRASAIEQVEPPENDVDRKIQEIRAALNALRPPGIGSSPSASGRARR